ERNSPLDNAKTTLFMTSGGCGEVMSRDTQPGSSAGFPLTIAILNAAMPSLVTEPFVTGNFGSAGTGPPRGTRIHLVPFGSCQLASAPGLKSAAGIETCDVAKSGVA